METEFGLYLKQKLDCVKYRIKMLDEIGVKLTEMHSIAVLAQDIELDIFKRNELNDRLQILEKEIADYKLDKKSN